MKRNLSRLLYLAITVSFSQALSIADDSETSSCELPKSKTEAKAAAKKPSKVEKIQAKSVEMFEAMDQKILTVDFIGKDATEANLIFRNQSNEPVNVILPATFGAVPVLAQGGPGMGLGQGAGFGAGQQGGGGGGQGMGGGFGAGQGQGMGQGLGMGQGMGQRGGLFRVEPDTPRKLTVATVCLNHGKTDPNPRMKYQVVRLKEVNDSPAIEKLCHGIGTGKVSQNVAQAAAWHVANGLTWEELAKKPKVVSEYTGVQLFFSSFEVQAALRLTEQLMDDGKSSNSYSNSRHANSETDSSMSKKSSESRFSSSYMPISKFAK